MTSETRIIDPRRLLNRQRLDLIVKWRLFRFWRGDKQYRDAEQDYLWHIDQRQGAQKPLQCYLPAARNLFTSMQAKRFDPAYAIPVNRSGMILEGAHRTACSIALGIKAHIRELDTDHAWPDWGAAWFRSHGMGIYLPGIEADYDKISQSVESAPTSESGARGVAVA